MPKPSTHGLPPCVPKPTTKFIAEMREKNAPVAEKASEDPPAPGCCGCASPCCFSTPTLTVLDGTEAFEAEKYLGKWYQTHASATVKYTFELGGNAVTAEYSETDVPNKISVVNTVRCFPRLGALFGKIGLGCLFSGIKISGSAVGTPTKDGVFSVGFFQCCSTPSFEPPGNYWILKLGPVKEGLYSWAVVSNDTGSQLYILCRDVPSFVGSEAEAEALAYAKEKGFTGCCNKPLRTNQLNPPPY